MQKNTQLFRQFEIPYNFDAKLIDGLQILDILSQQINCFYMPPFPEDYIGIIRDRYQKENLYFLTKTEYISQISYINKIYPNKLQLLLQQNDDESALNFEDKLPFYIDLGFNNFCVGSIKQAEIIKKYSPSATIIGSITMHINKEKLIENSIYEQYFNGFVLDFSFPRKLDIIKQLPKQFNYILLVNSYCSNQCNGAIHWNLKFGENFKCPFFDKKDYNFTTNCLVRPMDLFIFDPYIQIYKLQDRGWSTKRILSNIILYTSDNEYKFYPNIVYTEDIYNTLIKKE